jgi:hypothetical protein
MFTTKIAAVVLTLSITGLGFVSNQANAQAPLADQAVKRLVGKWVSPKGRTISFVIRDNNPTFQDELEPGVFVSGAYRQDDSGAGYVLRYTQGADCRYNVTVIGSEGNEINLRLVSETVPEGARFRCLEGTLRRTAQN